MEQADFAIICSSDLIAEVMQEYFTKKMFKKDVSIVDLKPTEDGYVFSLAFASQNKLTPQKFVDNVMKSVSSQRDVDMKNDMEKFLEEIEAEHPDGDTAKFETYPVDGDGIHKNRDRRGRFVKK